MEFVDTGIHGPDVSFYQAHPLYNQFINFQKMKDYGVHFVVIRAGQWYYSDIAFSINWKEAKRVGIPRAAYWFLDLRDTGKAQAERFWNLLKDDPGEGPLVVDFEYGSGDWRRLYDFIARLLELSKYLAHRIWIYTGYYYWLEFGPQTQAELAWFERFPLWLASYADSPVGVKVPKPWVSAVMWQKGTTVVWGPDLGVHSLELDWNIFNGDLIKFKQYWITDYMPPPPEQGGEEMEFEVVWSNGVARRTRPSTYNSYTGLSYSFGSKVIVIEENIPDADDPTNPNKKWAKASDGYFSAIQYPDSAGTPSVRMVKVATPPPTEKKIVKGVLHYDDNSTLELFPSG